MSQIIAIYPCVLAGGRRFRWLSVAFCGMIAGQAYLPGGVNVMGGAILGVVIIVLAIGCVLGWHANRAHAAHGDIKTVRSRIPGYRKIRLRSGLIVLGLAIVSVIIVRGMFGH